MDTPQDQEAPAEGEMPMPSAVRKRQGAPDAIKDALKAQLQAVLEKPLTAKMLTELSQTAELAHKMLIVAGEPRAIRNRRGRGAGDMLSSGYGGGGGMMDVIGPDDDSDGPLAPAPFGVGENFGAETLRNLVADANKPKLPELMRSLGIAQGLLDDARKVRDKSGIETAAHTNALADIEKKERWVEQLQLQIDETLAGSAEPAVVPHEHPSNFENNVIAATGVVPVFIPPTVIPGG